MSIESKGPGNVGNSYGSRGTNTPRQYDTAGVLKPDYQEFGEKDVPSALQALVSQDGIMPRADTLFPPEKVQLTLTGTACAAPCYLHRIRCLVGTTIALVVYDNPHDPLGTQLYSGTLSAGQEAVIPAPIRAINGPRGVFTGTATFEYYISQGI